MAERLGDGLKMSVPPPIQRTLPSRLDNTGKLTQHAPAIEALDGAPAIKQMAKEVTELHGRIADLARTEAGRDIRMAIVQSGIKHIVAALEFAVPYAVCPYWPQCRDGCKACGGKGWVCHGVYEKVPKAVRGQKK